MRTYAYLRTNNMETDRFTSFHKELSVKGYNVQINRVILELVDANRSIFYREKFMGLLNYGLEQDNLLIVKGIDCLGKDYLEILNTIDLITQKKIRLICLDYSLEELIGDIKVNLIHILKLCEDFEIMKITNNESIITTGLKKNSGRPKKLSENQVFEINEKIICGVSMYRLAKDYNVSVTVIRSATKVRVY